MGMQALASTRRFKNTAYQSAGRIGKTPWLANITEDTLITAEQSCSFSRPTRSGKGVGVVIPNCLNYSDSLVILDIKGENFDITSGYRAAHGQEVYLFAPFDPEGKTHRYNPLEYISSNEVDRVGDIDAIATALYNSESNGDKFWSENAKDLFCGLCSLRIRNAGHS